MGKKDILTQSYMKQNDKFADLCNFVLFDGEPVIKPEDLSEKDATELADIFGSKGSIQAKKVRDVLKSCIIKSTKHTDFVVLGIENQSDIHYAMSVRNMLYDALDYAQQVNEITRKHRENKDVANEEFLSGMTAHDKLRPVITITVYWKSGAWDGPRSIHDMLDVEDKKLLQFIPDYKLNLVVPDEITDFSKFSTELENVMEFIGCSDDISELKKLRGKIRKNDWLSRDAVELINTCTGAGIEMSKGRRQISMCEALEKLRAEDRIEAKIELLVDLVNENVITLDDAAKRVGMNVEEFKKAISK